MQLDGQGGDGTGRLLGARSRVGLAAPGHRQHDLLDQRQLPVGGELEYVDSGTLAQALRERKTCIG